MDDTTEKNAGHIRCEDELTLQKFLDEELAPDASELVFHHLKECQRCAAHFQGLKDEQSFCREQLGYEDESEADYSQAALRRVRIQLEAKRAPAPSAARSTESGDARLSAESEAQIGRSDRQGAFEFHPQEGVEQRESWFQRRRSGVKPRLGFWLRPGVVTAVLAVIVVAAGLTLWLRAPAPVSAAELLRRSIKTEEAMARRTETVLRRTFNLEERQAVSRAMIRRRRGDVWQSAEKGVRAFRLYDERGDLIAGEWRRAGGSRTIYSRHNQPQLQPSIESQVETAISFENVWQIEPSAKSFSALIKHPDRASIEEKPAAYVIRCADDATGGARGLMQAILVLSRADYRALEQTLVVRQGSEAREYRFIETSFEQRPASAAPPAVFEPELELLGPAAAVGHEPVKREPEMAVETEPLPSAVATTELEIKVLDLLGGIGADVGQEVSVTRTAKGRLQVQAAVETEQRKSEILRGLAPVKAEPAVILQIETVAEAQQRIARARRPSNSANAPAEVATPTITLRETIPAHNQVRRYLSARGKPGERVEAEISRVATRMLKRSNQALLRALALKNLAYRFSREDLRALETEARVRWLAMLGGHAQTVNAESAALKQELSAIFDLDAPAPQLPGQSEITDETSLVREIANLVEWVSANDEAIRSAFTMSSEATSARITDTEFWRRLSNATELATRIQKATQKMKGATEPGRR